ncbi:MAG: flagellin lysine-N-methylase [Oscillospiraceae bacterium]|jgi:lysine-N-methylase
MKIRIPNYYTSFRCAAVECSDPCCSCWEVVTDEASREFYKTVEGPLGEKLRSSMYVDQDGDTCFRLQDGKCPFFLDNHLCEIQKDLGEAALCNTCDMYPRFDEVYGNLEEMGLCLSCPEAAHLILGKEEKVEFILFDNGEDNTEFAEDFDGELLVYLIRAREMAIDILQDRTFPIDKRIAMFLQFTDEVQKLIDKETLELIPKLLKEYEKPYTRKVLSDSYESLRGRWIDKREILDDYFRLYSKELEVLNPEWKAVMHRLCDFIDESFHGKRISAFLEFYREKEYQFENLMVYFVYRYFLQSICDGELCVRARFAVLSYLIIRELDVFYWSEQNHELSETQQIDLMHRYAREIEHSQENLDILLQAFLEREEFAQEALISVLIN